MLATIIMALAMLVTGTVTSLAQPEPSFRATCSELRAAVARLELAGDPLVTIQVEGRLTTVKSESGLVYLSCASNLIRASYASPTKRTVGNRGTSWW